MGMIKQAVRKRIIIKLKMPASTKSPQEKDFSSSRKGSKERKVNFLI